MQTQKIIVKNLWRLLICEIRNLSPSSNSSDPLALITKNHWNFQGFNSNPQMPLCHNFDIEPGIFPRKFPLTKYLIYHTVGYPSLPHPSLRHKSVTCGIHDVWKWRVEVTGFGGWKEVAPVWRWRVEVRVTSYSF